MTRSEFNIKELDYEETKEFDTYFRSEDVNEFLNEIEDEIKGMVEELESITGVGDLWIVEDVLDALRKFKADLY